MAFSNDLPHLEWLLEQNEAHRRFLSKSLVEDEPGLAKTVEAAAIKAIDLLDHNLRDDSMYLLFEWDAEAKRLQIALTDASKTQDAPDIVHLQLPNVIATDELRESIKFYLHDFLCSYPGFLRYSLVAAFHSSNRKETELL